MCARVRSSREVLERLVELEADVQYQESPEEGDSRIGFLRGSTPALLSAPHAAVHTRQGQAKEEEEFTAAMACLVAETTGAHALYLRRRSSTDPNWHVDVPYKRRLAQIATREGLHFVLDIHGASPLRPFGVALGTVEERSCPEQRDGIIRELEAFGFRPDARSMDRLDVDETFTGRGQAGQETIICFVSEALDVDAAQIELHPLVRVVERREDATLPRPFRGDPDRIGRVVRALSAIVDLVAAAHTSRLDIGSARPNPGDG